MSISSEISRLNAAKTALAAQIKKLGVSVPSSATLDEYPSLLDTGISNLLEVKEVTLGTVWADGKQTVTVNGISANSAPVIDVKLSHLEDEQTRISHNDEFNKILFATTNTNSITFYLKEADNPTTTSIIVRLKGV